MSLPRSWRRLNDSAYRYSNICDRLLWLAVDMKLTIEPVSILDFDCESRPLSYLGNDFTTAEITAIACSFGLDDTMYCWLLGRHSPEFMLEEFVKQYDRADIVTGHYIRRFDLPLINGALLEHHMRPLKPKLTIDTKMDLVPIHDLSKSQESLGDIVGTVYEKIHMSQMDWREANRLKRIEAAQKRVTNDVRQHQEMRLALVKLGMLTAPKVWSPEV